MSYKLFLDDVRDPSGVHMGNPDDWIVCRSMQEAVNVISDLGWPNIISFDHDLGNQEPTGMDFAKWLVNLDLDGILMPDDFQFHVHSANPTGAANIQGLLDNYMATKKE